MKIYRVDGTLCLEIKRDSLYEVDLSRADLSRADLRETNLYGANLSKANLYRTDLSEADLSEADLRGADLRGADLIDGGQDTRGFRFWAWSKKGGVIIYRAGCHEWDDFNDAVGWYSENYSSTGDRLECLTRLDMMRTVAKLKGWWK